MVQTPATVDAGLSITIVDNRTHWESPRPGKLPRNGSSRSWARTFWCWPHFSDPLQRLRAPLATHRCSTFPRTCRPHLHILSSTPDTD
jgi:hypothetical protein